MKGGVQEYEQGERIGDRILMFYDVRSEPFCLYGLYDYKNQELFKRIPDEVAKSSVKNMDFLYRNTAGVRAHFSTDSQSIAIQAGLEIFDATSHIAQMTLCGTSGFDLYVYQRGRYIYYNSFLPPYGMTEHYEAVLTFPTKEQRDVMINFPIRCNVISLKIGLEPYSRLTAGRTYCTIKPIVYYGSSITQGTCASRPGNNYPAIISRELDVDFLNLGFAGNAMAEEEVAQYIADLDMSAFVYDYDYNAPTADYLQGTHKKFFDIIRKVNPDLPVIMVSRPNFDMDIRESEKRREIILKTYLEALDKGDENVYFVDGETLFPERYRDCCLSDSIHPNDFGLVCMADKIGFILKRALKKVGRL